MSGSEADRSRYTRAAVALHWLVAALVLVQVTWGWTMQQIPKQPAGLRADAFNVHKSIGLVLLALMLIRLGWRLAHPPPPLTRLPAWQRLLATWTHRLLYVALIVQPVTGYLGSVFSGYPVKWFGVVLPAWGWASPAMKDAMSAVHLVNSIALVGLVLLHVAGALRHALARDGYFSRMTWRAARPQDGAARPASVEVSSSRTVSE